MSVALRRRWWDAEAWLSPLAVAEFTEYVPSFQGHGRLPQDTDK